MQQGKENVRVSGARAAACSPSNHIAVRAISKRSRKRPRPRRIVVVNRHKSSPIYILFSNTTHRGRSTAKRTTLESDPISLRRLPVRERRAPRIIPKPDHTAERGPAVLAQPPIRAARPTARPHTAVRRTVIRIGKAESR